ncbi:MAG: prolyl oligopeptidase family serine peptidase [Verrucomicrobiales bacterium]|nr:prolyl oligopeptidase family serine peptidase [Verrucomicrobiales bacterium]
MCRPVFAAAISLISATALIAQENKQTPVTFKTEVSKELTLHYLLSVPEGFDASDKSKKWPLVVFLHGAGERGDDLEKVKIHGPPKLVAAGKKFPFVLISPQCPKDSWWTKEPVLELIEDAEKHYNIDPNRIYLTGLSMGGYGTWHFATEAPARFAAIVPICGGGTPYFVRRITHVPVWAFHGAKDTVIPLQESERLIEVLKKRGNKQVKLTVYPNAGHDSWTEAYNTEALFRWLLSHSRQEKKKNG